MSTEQQRNDENFTETDLAEFNNSSVVRVVRNAISDSPLTDELDVRCSTAVQHPEQVETIYNEARATSGHMAMITLRKENDRHFVIRIVSGQFRDNFVMRFKELLAKELPAKVQYYGSKYDYRKGLGGKPGVRRRVIDGLRDSGLLD